MSVYNCITAMCWYRAHLALDGWSHIFVCFFTYLCCQPTFTQQHCHVEHTPVRHHVLRDKRWMTPELERRAGAQVPGLRSSASTDEEEEGELQHESASSSPSSSIASPAPKVTLCFFLCLVFSCTAQQVSCACSSSCQNPRTPKQNSQDPSARFVHTLEPLSRFPRHTQGHLRFCVCPRVPDPLCMGSITMLQICTHILLLCLSSSAKTHLTMTRQVPPSGELHVWSS